MRAEHELRDVLAGMGVAPPPSDVPGEGAERARLAIEAAQLGTWTYDTATDLVHLDERMRAIWGEFHGGAVIPLPMAMQRIHPGDRERVGDAIGAALDGSSSGVYDVEYRIVWPDGSERWVLANGQALFEGDGDDRHAVRFVGTAVDITERKQTEAALRESEVRYRQLFNSIDEGYCLCEIILDEDGHPADYRFLDVNPHFHEMTGIAPDAQGRTARELVPGLEDWWVETYGRVASTGEPARFEQGSEAMGRVFDVYVTRVGEPESKRFAIVFNDITERRRAESMLNEQTRLLEMIAAGRPLEECLTALCSSVARLSRDTRASVLLVDEERLTFPRSVAPDLPSFREGLKDAPINDLRMGAWSEAVYSGKPVACADIASDERWSKEWRELCLANGVAACHSNPVPAIDGLPVATFMLCFDEPRGPTEWELLLSEFGTHIASIAIQRERASRALRQTHERTEGELAATRQLQSISTQMIPVDDPGALYEQILDAAMAIMRSQYASIQMYHPDRGTGGELQLLGFRGFNPEAAQFWEWVRIDSESTCGHALRTGARSVVTDVEQCDFMAGSADLATYLQTGIHAVQTTPLISRTGQILGMISTHWTAPHEPAASELRTLDVLARQAADLIERAQAETALRDREARYSALVGATSVGVVYGHDDQITEANDAFLRIIGWTRAEFEGGEVTWRAITAPGYEEVDQRAYEQCRATGSASYEKEYVHRDGSLVGVNIVAAVIRQEPYRWISVVEDVSERRRQEAELLRALAAKDEFLGLVSHELRTPITTVMGNAEILARLGEELPPEQRQASIRDIKHEAERLNRIISDLLTLARAERGALEIEPLAFARVVRDIVDDYREESAARVELTGDEADILANGETGVVSQIVRNYLSNAEKYGRKSTIEVLVDHTATEARVRVRDRGIGVDVEEAERLFDTFYRSKDAGAIGGLGIGLSVCRRLADALGGRVWGKPRAGGGSEFGLSLPLYSEDSPD